ncbi:MAG: hypothetical protein IJ191_00220 [Treponema sp.]|nr:hypothetical protein [Treponema sp.]
MCGREHKRRSNKEYSFRCTAKTQGAFCEVTYSRERHNAYGNFEKVGELPVSLPRNDTPTDTDAGDIILYLGKRFVIYYDKNSWNFTPLGKVDGVTKAELKRILGAGNVTAVLSLAE